MLQINNTLEVYPTSRAIRERLMAKLTNNRLLPKTITIGEFEKKSIFVEGKIAIDEETRVTLMQEAAKFENFKALNIDREFFAFLKNSKYLFSFYEELAVEMIEINTLKNFDTYAHYHEHLEILDTLRERYIQLLEDKSLFDKMTLPSLYRLNEKYISSFDKIELYLEGYLSKFEISLFLKIAQITDLVIHLHTNEFNQKMIDRFKEEGFEIQSGFYYQLDLSHKQVLTQLPEIDKRTKYEVSATQNAIEQIAFIKKRVYDFIQKGYAPEEIAVILPKSSTSELLDLFDEENNFNFAMGFSYKKSNIYKKLSALYEYYLEQDYQNRYRLLSLGYKMEDVYEIIKDWGKKTETKKAAVTIKELVAKSDDEVYEIFEDELYLFTRLLPSLCHYPFHKIIHLFLNRLAKNSLDDTRGGKITVMEILETRAVTKEALIVIDFNDGVLPSSSKKDLFLTSYIRSACNLPTPQDRENLQKYYYKRVFDQAKEVFICYISDEQNQPSRFLDELLPSYKLSYNGNLKKILLPFHKPKKHFIQTDLILKYDFEKVELSATRLKNFLDCKRKYYFKYIKNLNEFEIPKDQDDERIIGTYLHEALKYAYEKKESYFSEEELLLELQRYLYQISEKSITLRFLIDIWLEKLKRFVSYEIKRFHEGFKIYSVEKTFTQKFQNLMLTGKIDRIDIKDDQLFIIDYKSGKIPKTSKKSLPKSSDFQLQFYYLLTNKQNNIFDAFYYDLNSANLINDSFFEEKLELLYQHLNSLNKKEYNFTMCEDLKKCLFCPYQKICNRVF